MIKRISLSFFTVAFLTLVSAAILFCLGLISQFSGFAVFGSRSEAALKNTLQEVLTNRIAVFEKDIQEPLHEINLLIANPVFQESLGGSAASNSAETLQGLFAARGFTAVQLQDNKNKLVYALGKFTQSSKVVVPLNLPYEAKLIWKQGWMMRVTARLVPGPKQKYAGVLMVEWPLTQINNLYQSNAGLGKNGEFHICTLNNQDEAVCSPERLKDEPLVLPLIEDGKPTAMSYALAGQKGQLTAINTNKNEILEAYSPIGTLGLAAIAHINTAEIYEPVRQQVQIIIPIFFLFVCLGMLWLYWKVSLLVKKLTVAEVQLEKMAYHDALTGLDNRSELEKNILFALRIAKQQKSFFALIFLDLDHFKKINDTLGHDGGDQLLKEVAKRLTACVRHTDKIGRLGGDEFVILITDFQEVSFVAKLAEKILAAITAPMQIKEKVITITSSVGISIFPDDGLSMETLLEHADMALYRAKEFGKNNYQFFGGKVDVETKL
ncbi:MAG: GGDEF domain-containing protein [Pseudomonadota bacterium]